MERRVMLSTWALLMALVCSTMSASLTSRTGQSEAEADCVVTGATWSYLDPVNFEGVAWTNEAACLYEFVSTNASAFSFASPTGCLTDPWTHATGVITRSNGRAVSLHFHTISGLIVHKGWVTPDCNYIDMDDGGLYIRGVHPMDMSLHGWLQTATAWVMRAAMITFKDGTRHLTPGVPKPVPIPSPNDGYYVGQWMRDGFYGISNGWALVNETMQQSFVDSLDWMFAHAREDGMIGESCQPDGHCVFGQYCQDQPPAPGWQGCQTLDTCSFSTKLAAHLWNNADSATAAQMYKRWLPILIKAMEATTKAPDASGLIWSNTSRPQVGYGFQDDETKSGVVLYSNILYWNASMLIAEMAARQGDTATQNAMLAQAQNVQRGVVKQLWNASAGVFMASTGIEKDRIDVWGNAMAVAMNFTTESQGASIFNFFKTREQDIFYEGQVREIPFPDQWTDAPVGQVAPKSTQRIYQNGGFWATPHHHVLPFLARYDKDMACRLLNDTIKSFRGHGIWEWVGPFFPSKIVGAPGYTASAADTYFASEHIKCWQV